VSQLLREEADTEILTAPAELVIVIVCAAGVVPPCELKVSCGGLDVSVPFCALAVSERHNNAAKRVPKMNDDFPRFFTNSSIKN